MHGYCVPVAFVHAAQTRAVDHTCAEAGRAQRQDLCLLPRRDKARYSALSLSLSLVTVRLSLTVASQA
jgi:hypothetical protein